MQEVFKNQIESEFSFMTNSRCILAISGGIDSVVLTYLLHDLNIDFALAHCNFNLRGQESDEDPIGGGHRGRVPGQLPPHHVQGGPEVLFPFINHTS